MKNHLFPFLPSIHGLRLRVVPCTLHFKQPAGTSRGVYTSRSVWYVVARAEVDGKSCVGVGECAHLPDLSSDYTPDYAQRLRAICDEAERCGGLPFGIDAFPSMRFGLETALLSLKADATSGNPYNIFPETNLAKGLVGTPINGLVWMGSHDEMLRRMEEKLADGFRCVKLKIGAIGWEQELDLLHLLRQRFNASELELRVDANGAFAPEEASQRLRELSVFDLHSIEQPIRAGQREALASICRTSPLPVALDEELIGIVNREEKRQLLQKVRPNYLVLKPSLHGGIAGCCEWTELATEEGIGWWLTSALESNVGLNAIARFQAALGGPAMPQGLGTGRLFVSNFGPSEMQIKHECLWLYNDDELAHRAAYDRFRNEWNNDEPAITLHTSGSTGKPKTIMAEKERMRKSAEVTIRTLGVTKGSIALICLPMKYIAAQMMAVRCFVGALRPVLVAPSSRPFRNLHRAPDFAALTPMQVFESLSHSHDRRILRSVRWLIIGGGAVDASLAEALKTHPGAVYSTYGMTETLSHVALRRLSGTACDDAYTPLPGVCVSIGEEGCLRIDAPAVCERPLLTNDLGEVLPDGRFRVFGRRDNVVISGGLKFHLEELESMLTPHLSIPFCLTAVSDPRLGEALTLLYIGTATDATTIEDICRTTLTRHAVPRHFFAVSALPLTETGKPARAAIRSLAQNIFSGKQ